ncbi:MAG: mechanosensitive ion channel family protein, partial [Chloroflexota bacterium]|nr:mechanosensitive ion channel family protein [Chloroflexota bacterium]
FSKEVRTVQSAWEAIRNWLLTSGLRIAFILVASLMGYRLLRTLMARLERLMAGKAPTKERAQRARTLAGVLNSAALVAIASIAGMMILRELGLDIAPLIAGAGIAGLALGLGAQSLIRDVIGGFLILLEDQFVVGDAIKVGDIAGGVERMTLRATFVRDLEGTLHIIPNGEMHIVSNRTKDWSRAIVNLGVAYEEDIGRVMDALREVGRGLKEDEEFASLLLEEPTVSGVEALGDWAVTVRIMVKTKPGEQWSVARELRRRVKESFESEEIEMPYPRQEVLMRTLTEAEDT